MHRFTSHALVALSGLTAITLLVVGSILVVDASSTEDVFCTLEALLDDGSIPNGWVLRKDHVNECAWTLFDPIGRRAPSHLYEGLPIEPPPTPPSNIQHLAGIVAILGGLAVAGWTAICVVRDKQRENGRAGEVPSVDGT